MDGTSGYVKVYIENNGDFFYTNLRPEQFEGFSNSGLMGSIKKKEKKYS